MGTNIQQYFVTQCNNPTFRVVGCYVTWVNVTNACNMLHETFYAQISLFLRNYVTPKCNVTFVLKSMQHVTRLFWLYRLSNKISRGVK